MFRLTAKEKAEVVTNCDHLAKLKFSKSLPFAFTEHGAIQAANTLSSPQAVKMGVYVVRAFVQLRNLLASNRELVTRLDDVEQKIEALAMTQDTFARNTKAQLKQMFDALRELMTVPEPSKRPIGFVYPTEKIGATKGRKKIMVARSLLLIQRMRLAGLFLLFLTFGAPALAQEASEAVQTAREDNRISPPKHRNFRMPLYPASEREAKTTGTVDITMVVSADGRLVEIKSTTSEPKNAVFEQVTQEAVAKWQFSPGLKRCVPVQAEANYRVYFEFAHGSDHVRAVPLLSKSQTPDPSREMISPNKNEMLRTIKYPVDARRAGAQGSVYLMLKVNPANGVIDSIDLASANSTKAGFERNFIDTATEVARKIKFTPKPELKRMRLICVPFVFALE